MSTLLKNVPGRGITDGRTERERKGRILDTPTHKAAECIPIQGGAAGQRQALRPPTLRNNSSSSLSLSPCFGCARRNPFCDPPSMTKKMDERTVTRLFQQKQCSKLDK